MKMLKTLPSGTRIIEGKVWFSDNSILHLETGKEGFDINCIVPKSLNGKFVRITMEEIDGFDCDMEAEVYEYAGYKMD